MTKKGYRFQPRFKNQSWKFVINDWKRTD